jgi:cell division protease FtsH
MNPNFQKLAIWVAVLVLLAALFNLFNSPAQNRRGNEITYSEFIAAVDGGRVTDVTIAGNRIYGSLSEGGQQFTTYAPDDRMLVERLEKKGVKFKARPSDEDVPSLMSVLLNWFPMLLLIGVGVLHAPDAVGVRPRHGLRQEPCETADRAPGPSHV